MPEQTHKLVHVPDVGVVAFPGDLEDAHVTNAIKLFRAQNKMASQPKMDPRLADVEKQFPRLSPYLKNVQIQQGQKASPTDDRSLEFYPPWESQNPNPGKITLELYDKMQGPALTSALGGDLLHYLGGIDPKTQKPVDPQYYAMKQAVLKARTPQQDALDKRIYADAVKTQGEKRPYDQWLQQSRVDAYIRGYVTPELGGKYPDEWRKNGFYKDPNMLKAVQAIQKYVTSAAAKPASLFAGKTTEASEHARQLKPAQSLSTAIPKIPEWATTPIATDADLDETPKGKAITAASQKAFEIAHPKIEAALEKGNNPVVLGGLKGATEFTKGMATPANLATLLALPESKLLSAFFTVQALKGSYQDANAARKAYEAGNNEEAASYATKALLGAGMGVAAGAHAYKGLPEGVRTRLANEDGSVGPQEGGAERRANQELRKRIDEMTPEEMRKILKTSDVVDLPNKRSFQEDQHFSPMPFVARSDADGLKAFNDKFGYEKGDELLRAKAEALKEAGLNAYHEKGDEFLYRGKSDKELAGRLEKAREILRNKVFDVTLDDGTHVQLKGVDFSYGTGKDLKEAETRQHAHKAEREAAGQRKRGELVGLTEVGPQADSQGQGPAQGGAAPALAEIKKQAAELKPTTAYQAIDQSQPFYLKSENLINEKMKGPMAAEDIHKMLLSNGVKPEEMQWTGLDEFLKSKGKGKVTPQEMQELLAANNLQVKEVFKGQPQPTQWTDHYNGVLTTPEGYKIERLDSNGKYIATSNSGIRQAFDTIDEAKNKVDDWRKNSSEDEVTPKFSSYQLPGGENYRELLLTMPPRRMTFDQWRDMIQARTGDRVPDNEAERKAYQADVDYRALREGADFRSSHWDEPNVLGHIRFNDRKGPNGEKILHLEELQSDWGQKIRKEGVKKSAAELANLPMKATPYNGYWEVHTDDGQFVTNVQDWQHPEVKTAEDAIKEARRRIVEESNRTQIASKGQPAMPFSKTWPELLLKRMVKYAADHGYQGVSWTPGEEQASRYDLSKYIDTIDYNKTKDGKYRIAAGDKTGHEQVLDGTYSESELPDVVGKEVAQKIVNGEGQPGGGRMTLRNVDLKVGGSGMKGFYDKIIPDAANKLGKQWGAKVGKIDLNTGKPISGQGWEQEPMWDTIARDGRLGKMPLYAIFDEGGNWVGTTGDPESGAIQPGEHVIQVADENGHLLKHVALPSKSKSVPYLPLKSKTGAGVKSVPYSLFGVAGAAVGLQAVKQKAEELHKKFREAGLSQ